MLPEILFVSNLYGPAAEQGITGGKIHNEWKDPQIRQIGPGLANQ